MSVQYRLQVIFRDVFEDPRLEISNSTSMESYPDWDSVATIRIVLAAEAEFGVRFTTDQVAGIRSVADLMRVVDTSDGAGER